MDKMAEVETRLDTRLKWVVSENADLKSAIEFQSENLENLEKDTIPSLEIQLKETIERLEKKIQYQEHRDRKYNLLFCGIPQTSKETEDTEIVVRKFMSEKMELTDEQVWSVL